MTTKTDEKKGAGKKRPNFPKRLQKPLSLYPMSFDEAVDALLAYKPGKEPKGAKGEKRERDGPEQLTDEGKTS